MLNYLNQKKKKIENIKNIYSYNQAFLNLLLCPEIQELNDVTTNVGESLAWQAIIKGNPKPDITWSKDGKVLEKGERYDFEEDKRNNKFTLVIKEVEIDDKGAYQVTAKNYLGEASAQAILTPYSKSSLPEFSSP